MNDTAAKKKSKMTLELDMETLAELKAATVILGAKSYASLIHQKVVATIREAKTIVSKVEFDEVVAKQKIALHEYSERKSLEREKSLQKREKPSNKKGKTNTITTGDGKTYPLVEEASPVKSEDDK